MSMRRTEARAAWRLALSWAAIVLILAAVADCGGSGRRAPLPGGDGSSEDEPPDVPEALPGDSLALDRAPVFLWLNCSRNGNEIELAWELSAPGDEIAVFRGDQPVAVLAGDDKGFVYEEDSIGYFRYTVAVYAGGIMADKREALMDLGRVVWDVPPGGGYSGFYIYVAEAVLPDPYQVLPYGDPTAFDFDAGLVTSVALRSLYLHSLIKGSTDYFLAAATYLGHGPQRIISQLSAPVQFRCQVEVGEP